MPNEPRLEFLFRITALLSAPIGVGNTMHGNRAIVPVTSGTVEGPSLKGTALPPAADWVLVRPDGVGELDVRLAVQTDDGALVYITYRGYLSNLPGLMPRWAAGERIPREEYYFVSTPVFETSSDRYAWLQSVVAIGIGELIQGGVAYDVYAVGSAVGANPLPRQASAATS